MLPHYEWCWWVWSFLYLRFEGLLDNIAIVWGQRDIRDRSLILTFFFLGRRCFFSCFLAFAHPILDGLVCTGSQSEIYDILHTIFLKLP
jgi:hypothetical protein